MIRTEYFGPQSSPVENEAIGRFVSELIWHKPDAVRDFCSMAVIDGDQVIAGTLYHNWHPENGVIELTSAAISRRWLTRPVIRAMFDLPFERLGSQMVVLRVSEKNKSMIRIARAFGFSEHFIPRLGGRDEGQFIFTYTDDQWSSSAFKGNA